MADISKVILPNNETYNLKDSVARESIPTATTTTPKMDGTAAVGSETKWAKGDHVHPSDTSKVNKSGDTMTGLLKLKGNQFTDSHTVGALDLQNSNIIGTNGIYFSDSSDGAGEAINFYRDATHADSIHAYNGALYFTPNRELGTTGTSKRVIVDGSTFPEAYLSWGGRNFAASYGPIDAAMVSELGANRFAFLKPAGVTIEYSRDNGETWVDYGATDNDKAAFFGTSCAFTVGKSTNTDANRANANCLLRVTIDTNLGKVYSVLNKFVMYVSTVGSSGCWCSLDAATHGAPDTWVNKFNKVEISGWSGYNVINTGGITTYGNSNSHYQYLRFTFGITSQSSSYAGLQVFNIRAFGGVGWTTPSNMAAKGHLYSYDYAQNATFPAKVTATEFSGIVNATTATGTLPIAHGGTGKTTAIDAANNLIKDLAAGSSDPVDGDTYIASYADGKNVSGTGTNTFHRRPIANLWNYIKGKANAVYLPLTGGTLSGNLKIGNPANSNTLPTAGITVHDIRGVAIENNSLDNAVNFFFTNNSTPDNNWWSGMHVRGWQGGYASWELLGPANNSNQKTTPLYVRSGSTDNTWGSWRKIYDTSNPPTAAEVGAIPANNILTVDKGGTGLSSLTSGSFLRANSDLSFGQRTPAQVLSDIGALAASKVGAANGVAPLNNSGQIDQAYLPSYVDDIIEGYYYNNKFYTTSAHTTEISGETGKIFVDLSTNKTYRYSGSAFVEVSQGSVVTISRNLTSGTKIGTITIDGTGTDLYAPSLDGYVPTSRTINSKALTGNITLTASDVGAATSGHTHTTTIASGGTSQINLSANTAYTLTAGGTSYVFKTPADSDTKNTAGSTDTSSEIYLVGATSQAANPQTYSHDTARVRANGRIVGSGYEFAVASAMGTTKATMVYDSTLEAIAFQFD